MKTSSIVALLASALIAAVIVPPLFIKPVVQEQLAQWQEAINNQAGYSLAIEPKDSGWFSSAYKATLSYDLAELSPAFVNKSATLQLDLLSSYGPLLMSDSIHIGVAKWTATVSRDGIPENLVWDELSPLYRIEIRKHLTGKYVFEDRLKPFEMNDRKLGIRLVMGGYESSGSYEHEVLSYQGHITSLHSDYGVPIVLENYQLDGIFHGSLEDIFTAGLVEHNVKTKADLITAGEITIQGAKGTSLTVLDGRKQLGKLVATANANRVGFNNYQAQDVVIDVEFSNLNNEFVRQYYDFVMSNVMLASPKQRPELLGQFFGENLIALLKPNPEINITRLQAKFREGNVYFGAHSRIEGVDEQLDPMKLVNYPADILQFVQADAFLLVDEALLNVWAQDYAEQQFMNTPHLKNLPEAEYEKLLQQTQQRYLAGLLKQRMLVKGDSHYSSEFRFANGVALLNNQPVNL